MIVIVPYKPTWRDEFLMIGRDLRKNLGELALRIDHIGSTSIPDLAAKDIIDIQVTVIELSPSVNDILRQTGYQRIEEITQDHIPPLGDMNPAQWIKWYYKPAIEIRPIHLHVRISGRANQRYPLLFRDYLRANPAVAQAYAQVKSALAKYHANDVDAYYDVKDPVCDVIMGGASFWAEKTNWRPAATDC